MIRKILFVLFINGSLFASSVPLAFKNIDSDSQQFSRGVFLVVLSNASNKIYLDGTISPNYDFVGMKETQGFDVDVVVLDEVVEDPASTEDLKSYLMGYKQSSPMLEYVLFVGDASSSQFIIPTYNVEPYNYKEEDPIAASDYPYSYNLDFSNPQFFIGRWSISSNTPDLLNIVNKNIQYAKMENIDNFDYLNESLIVAGNYKTSNSGDEVDPSLWPVTPVWTSQWIMKRLEAFGQDESDAVFFNEDSQYQELTEPIADSWNEGVGIVNYRGWGNSSGWVKPEFKKTDIKNLSNGVKLPVVFSFVCNTGDFNNSRNAKCFGGDLLAAGTAVSPAGAVAVVAPADLDTDTKFNNVICVNMWDALLEKRNSELGPSLFIGKNALVREYGSMDPVNGIDVVEFYHKVYNVLGDPSLDVWLSSPSEMSYDFVQGNSQLVSSHIKLKVLDESGLGLEDVVGALIHEGELIAKGLSNVDGFLEIDFSNVSAGSSLDLYLNKSQFLQKKIDLTFESEGEAFVQNYNYVFSPIIQDYGYTFYSSKMDTSQYAPEYDWYEISDLGENLNLTDDDMTTIDLGFTFKYYGQEYNKLVVCSNGWVSFDESENIPYFYNYSIPSPLGPDAMIAVFMDDLDDNVGEAPFDVFSYYDTNSNRHIIQWNNILNGYDDTTCQWGTVNANCTYETFQLVLMDPAFDSSQRGEGKILVQLKEIGDVDAKENYSTIGIESKDQNEGVQYLYNRVVANGEELESEVAILFTTDGYIAGSNDTGGDNSIEFLSSPNDFKIQYASPNPFNASTSIKYSLEYVTTFDLSVYSIQGRKIFSKKYENKAPGEYLETITLGDLPSGLYIIAIESKNKFSSYKVLLIK